MSVFDICGLLGAAFIVAAYAGVQMKRFDSHGLPALTLNVLGPSLVLVSLYEDFNWAALVLQIVWIAISLRSLALLALRRRQGGAH